MSGCESAAVFGDQVVTSASESTHSLLRFRMPDRDHDAAALCDPAGAGRRECGGNSRSDDGIERGSFGESERSVSANDFDIVVPEVDDSSPGRASEVRDMFNRENPVRKVRQHTGPLACAGSDLKDCFGADEQHCLAHECDGAGLRNRLTVNDRQ